MESGLSTRQAKLNVAVSDLTFRDFLGIIKRQKWLVVLNVLLFAAIGTGISFLIPKEFVSSGRVLIEGRTLANPTGTGGDVVSQLSSAASELYDVGTQIQVIQSQEILFRAFEQAGIPLPQTQRQLDESPRVEVQQIGDTNVVQINVVARDPQQAQGLARAVPAIYSEYARSRGREGIASAIQFVNTRIEEEQANVTKARDELAAFQTQNGVSFSQTEMSESSDVERQLQLQVTEAEAQVRGAEAALEQARASRAAIPPTVELPIVRTNREQMEIEKKELQRLIQRKEELLVLYLPDHPSVKAAETSIQQQKAYIASLEGVVTEKSTVRNPQLDSYDQQVANAESGLRAVIARRDQLKAEYDTQKSSNAGKGELLKQLMQLEANLNAASEAVTQLRQTAETLKLRDNELKSATVDINRSTLARQVAPNFQANIISAAIFGLLIGALVAFVRDLNQDKVNTVAQASDLADMNILARIPRRSRSAHPLIFDGSVAKAFESYRILRTNLENLGSPGGNKAVLVTSTLPGEGASTVAGNLAIALAQDGRKVVLVDCNFRDPSVAKRFGLSSDNGLVDVLSKGADPMSVLQDSKQDGLKVLVTGGEISNSTEVLGSAEMANVLEKLASENDYVILDAPAAYTTADAHKLTGMAGSTVYVMELGRPSKTQFLESSDMLRAAKGRIAGLVLNKDPQAAERIA